MLYSRTLLVIHLKYSSEYRLCFFVVFVSNSGRLKLSSAHQSYTHAYFQMLSSFIKGSQRLSLKTLFITWSIYSRAHLRIQAGWGLHLSLGSILAK